MSNYNIVLDTDINSPIDTNLKFTQGDKGQVLNLIVTDFDTTGTTAKIIFRKADGNVVEGSITATNGIYPYTIKGTEFECVGKVVADVKFYKDNVRISTAKFTFAVESDTINNSLTESKAYSDTLEQMQEFVDGKLAELEDKAENVLDAAEQAVQMVLPVATANTLGGIKSAGHITVGADGTPKLNNIVNNGATTQEGFVLDARYGKTLADNIDNITEGSPTITGTHQYTKNVSPSESSWRDAPIVLIAPTNSTPTARAGISFENEGIIGGMLYLDNDGTLKYINNLGIIKTINMS